MNRETQLFAIGVQLGTLVRSADALCSLIEGAPGLEGALERATQVNASILELVDHIRKELQP